jgi:hypothetical protein
MNDVDVLVCFFITIIITTTTTTVEDRSIHFCV